MISGTTREKENELYWKTWKRLHVDEWDGRRGSGRRGRKIFSEQTFDAGKIRLVHKSQGHTYSFWTWVTSESLNSTFDLNEVTTIAFFLSRAMYDLDLTLMSRSDMTEESRLLEVRADLEAVGAGIEKELSGLTWFLAAKVIMFIWTKRTVWERWWRLARCSSTFRCLLRDACDGSELLPGLALRRSSGRLC